MVKRIAVGLSKGGVGKTTTAINLSHGLARVGKKVLLIDTDTQGQVSKALGVSPSLGLAELLLGDNEPKEIIFEARKNLSLISGGKALAGTKRFLDRKELGAESTLKEILEEIESEFDYVILDTAPSWDVLNVNGLMYCNEILAPVSLEALTLQAISDYQESIRTVGKYNDRLQLKYVLPTFFDKRVKKSDELLSQLKRVFGNIMCEPIRYNVKISESPAFGKSIFEHAPHSHGSVDYAKLIKRVIDS